MIGTWPCAAVAAALIGMGAAGQLGATPKTDVVVLAGTGRSFALGDRRVANLAPPSSELRVGFHVRPRLIVEGGLGLTAYPELVPSALVGLRVHPIVTGAGRHLFLRGGATTVLAVSGFDLALTSELGGVMRWQRLLGWLSVGGDRWILGPRMSVLARIGVGAEY